MLVDIREYYSDAGGEDKPGKKGISLTAAQFSELQKIMNVVASEIEKLKN